MWEILITSGFIIGVGSIAYKCGLRTANKYHKSAMQMAQERVQEYRLIEEQCRSEALTQRRRYNFYPISTYPFYSSPIPHSNYYSVEPLKPVDLSSSGIMEKVQENGKGTVLIQKGTTK